MSRADFHSLVLPVVASLSSYHNYIDPPHQQKVIRCLVKYGSAMRCSSQCISALTICTLEMRDVMVKLLPETLLSLSKISATVYIAIPLLEFLSSKLHNVVLCELLNVLCCFLFSFDTIADGFC